jgi:hypothetical protein
VQGPAMMPPRCKRLSAMRQQHQPAPASSTPRTCSRSS